MPLPEGPLKEFLDLAQKRLKRAIDADEHNRQQALEDLRFLNGDQWDPEERNRRKLRHRPALQVNLLPKYVDQVVGDERHNRPKIKVRPIDSKADPMIAKIREGIISNIEYNSNAPAIYDEAFESMVSCGYGAWRVLTRYTEENPFLQEIYLEAIENPFQVYLDPDAKDACFADAKWGFVLQRIPRDEFEDLYPNAEIPGDPLKTGVGLSLENWYQDNLVTIAEYFVRETKKKEICLMSTGEVLEKEDALAVIQEWEDLDRLRQNRPGHIGQPPGPVAPINPVPPLPGIAPSGPPQMSAPPANPMAIPGRPPTLSPQTLLALSRLPTPQHAMQQAAKVAEPKPEIIKTRESEEFQIKHYILTAVEILSEGGLSGKNVPGKFIPLILLCGKKRNIEGKRYIRGLIRDAKDPQRMINYWNSSAAETIALAPKAPWLGTAKQFEGYEADYATANVDNFPFLKYNPDAMAPPPVRMYAGEPPVALFAQIQRGEENLKQVIGMFNADIGDQGREITGAAIIQRQRPGDIGTFAFLDNLSRSVMHSARIINEMIPAVYDTERDVRVRHFDDSESFVPINTTAENAFRNISGNPNRFRGMDPKKTLELIRQHGRSAKFNDITVGKYDIMITIGPSYATARAEAVDMLVKLLQTNPNMSQVVMDLVVENMDFKDADKVAARLRRLLPPDLVPPKEGEPPPPPKPPPPQVLISQGKIQVEMAKIEVQKARLEVEKIKALKEAADARGDVKNLILSILEEVHAPEHPADQTPGLPGAATPQTQ